MRSRRHPEALVAVVAAVAVGAWFAFASSSGVPEAPVTSSSPTWRGLVGDAHPAVSLGQRMIVVLRTPSLAQRLTRSKLATEQDERRWTAQARAAQQQVLTQLARHGIDVRPDYSYARVLDGFAAPLDPRAVALLQRNPEVAGVYAVRAAFPATVDAGALERGAVTPSVAAALPGADGHGVSIALLDTGVDRFQTYLGGRVLPGIDIVGGHDTADAQPNPQSPLEVERHGTELAGLLVGSGGPGGIHGAAPGATVIPIRVAGWQPDGQGHQVVYARSDQLIAGLDRAVDPNGDGDAHDAARVALIGVSEPFAAFADSPEAQAVAGAFALDMLVVAPAGNDGPAGPLFGSIDGPGGAVAALTVGATDTRPTTAAVRLVLRRGLDVLFDRPVSLLGTVAPAGRLTPELTAPRLTAGTPRFTGPRGKSLVAGRAVLVPAGDDPNAVAVAAAQAGAVAVLVYGRDLPAGSLGSAGDLSVPVVGVPTPAARAALVLLRRGIDVGTALGRAETGPNPELGQVPSFSSRGLSFGGFLAPELSAPGVGVATSDPGAAADGEPAFATASGTSVAAAAVAGAAAVLAEARPGLAAPDLASLLVGSTDPSGARLTVGGSGVLDVGSSAVGEVTASRTSLAFGAWSGPHWQATRSLTVRNVSTRRLVLSLVSTANIRGPIVSVRPARLSLRPGHQVSVSVRARAASRPGAALATGLLTVRPLGGQPLRIPWVIGFRRPGGSLLRSLTLDRAAFKASDDQPALLQVGIGFVAAGDPAQIEPASRVDILLYSGNGAFVGVLNRLHDLLPGSYRFGITGRGPGGAVLEPGRYELRLVAWPTLGKQPSRAQVGFRILG